MVWQLTPLLLTLTLGGCIFSSAPMVINAEIPTGTADASGNPKTVTQAVELDRWGAHTLVRMAEEETAQAYIAAATAGATPSTLAREEDITVVLDSPEAIQAWATIESTRSLSQANSTLGQALKNCLNGEKAPQIDLTRTASPSGVFAESVQAVTSGTATILNTPAAKVAATLLSGAALVDAAQTDQPAASIKAGGSVELVSGQGSLSKPTTTTTTEVVQPTVLD